MMRTRRSVIGAAVGVVVVIAGVAVGITALSDEDEPAAISAVDGSGPTVATGGLALTMQRLQGIWYEDRGTGIWPGPVMARFDADGTFALGGVLDQNSWLRGSYTVDEQTIRFTSTGGDCRSRDAFAWDVRLLTDGRFESVHAGADSKSPSSLGACHIPVREPYDFTRISPTSPGVADLAPSRFSGEPLTGDTDAIDLQGFWLEEDTGLLLWLNFAGSYRLDPAGELATRPHDAGLVEIGVPTLRFTTGGDAHGCRKGDVMVWEDLRVEAGTLRGSVREDACDRGLGGEVALIYLSVDGP